MTGNGFINSNEIANYRLLFLLPRSWQIFFLRFFNFAIIEIINHSLFENRLMIYLEA